MLSLTNHIASSPARIYATIALCVMIVALIEAPI